MTAAYTGLRINEFRQLLVADTHLVDVKPHFKVRSSTTKNRKDALIPIHSSLIKDLSELITGKKQGDQIFDLPKRPNETINWDYKRAGIPKFDALGRKVDFHALRNTFKKRYFTATSSGIDAS